MEKLVFQPLPQLEEALLDLITKEEKEIIEALSAETKDKPLADWAKTKEGAIHSALLYNYVVVNPEISVRRTNLMFMLCARKGQDTRGRPPLGLKGRHHPKYKRALRIYVLNKILARQLNIDPGPPPQFGDVCPDLAKTDEEPIECFEMLARFEEWTGYKLPHEAWVIFTREDRQKLADEATGWVEDGKQCMKLAEYIELRSTESGLRMIRKILSESNELAEA